MVQLNMLERFLSPVWDPPLKMTGEALREEIAVNLLLNRKRAVLKSEPKNNLTRLFLIEKVHFKLKRKSLNIGTQKESMDPFVVNEKQMSKLITGRCYKGGSSCLSHKSMLLMMKKAGRR